jgi:Prokaryotic homologs of the JAB domain
VNKHKKHKNTVPRISVKDTNILNIEVDNYDDCGFCKNTQKHESLKISWKIWSEWKLISQYMGDKEWAAVLWVEDNEIKRYQIPKQTVGGIEVELEEELGGNGLVHSHHKMGAFHSPQDDKHAKNLYEYSIVISSDDNICTRKISLPCNGFGYADVSIVITDVPVIDISMIKEKEYQSHVLTSGGYVRQDSYDWGEPHTWAGKDAREIAEEKDQRAKEEEIWQRYCESCTKYDCESCEHFIDVYSGVKSI